MMKYLQKLGKALMLPVAALPVCGILMGIGYALAPAVMGAEGPTSGAAYTVGFLLIKAGGALIDNMAWLFAIGAAVGLSDDHDGTAGLAGLVSFLMMQQLLSPGVVGAVRTLEEGTVDYIAFSKIAGNSFIGILAAIIGAACYNKFKNTQLPDWLAFFSGKRSVAIVTAVVSIVVSVVLLFVWPIIFGALVALGNGIAKMSGIGAGIYAFLNRLLIPTGLHHALNNVFWFDTIGLGDLSHYWAGDVTGQNGVNWDLGMYMSGLIYAELAKVEDSQIKHVSEYKFFERYGEVGEYMRLELKMLLRNRRCKGALRNIAIVVVAFSVALSFSSVYDGNFMTSFICVYNFAVFGMIILSQIMSFEGNYIDGLMSRKESIMSLLKAKYYTYSIGEIIPFILMIPAIIMNKLTLLGAFAWFFYTIGFIYFCFFQLAVYNKQTVPLNEKVASRQTNSAIQMVVNFAAFGVPLILYSLLNAFLGETITYIILLVVGLGFTLTSPLWIKNVYHRFMKRRYENMEGFRDSRQIGRAHV